MTQASPIRTNTPRARPPKPTSARLPAVAAGAGAAFYLGGGLWAMAAPRSFYDVLAVFPAYNQHFVQDIGALQLGLGVTLLLALWPVVSGDALTVVLAGTGVGSAAHVVSHVVGRDLGGNPETDIPLLSLLALLLLTGAVLRWRSTRPAQPPAD